MPIKFRCQHCRQFLGIAHSKAGTLVDCPACGRTIRVPDTEGNLAPLPELKLNTQDSKLAKALDELASLGRSDAEVEPESAVAVADIELPAPKPQIAAPVPIRVEPLQPAKPIPLEVHDPHKPAPIATMHELAALANVSTARDPAVEQAEVESQPLLNGRGSLTKPARHRISLTWAVVIAWLAFVVGFVAGRWDRNAAGNSVAKNDPAKKASAAIGPSGDPFANKTNGIAVRGRITFLTQSGERRPDRGARVLLLPEKREGSAKLSVVGFRSADADTDAQIAAAGLRALGGDVAVVDDSGNFEIPSLKPGTYRIVALSHFQSRDEKAAIEPQVKSLLDNYFDRSEQLLGKCRYHLGELKASGQRTEPWDFSFERE
jgi:hypothetical protein